MTLTNHILTGTVLAKLLPLPLAIPLAIVSHFILDALPHFGFVNIQERMKHLALLKAVIILDFILTVLISVWLVHSGHIRWLLVGLAAYSPDVLWIYRFVVEERFGKIEPTRGNRFIQFHRDIQKYERVWGGFVEIVYAACALLIVR